MNRQRRRVQRMLGEDEPFARRYELAEQIGSGSYSLIFGARDRQQDRPVAVKVITPEASQHSETAVARFRREMKVIRNLNHPNIIELYDWGWVQGGPVYMVLEYVDGKTLDEVVRAAPMDESTAVAVARQLADALDTAHQAGVIHRDLKPANVMLVPQQGECLWKVKVLDFGLAKVLAKPGDESLVDLTAEGMAVGTPRYIAPEQARGQEIGPESDLYAVGLLMFEMFTGRQLVAVDSVQGAVALHVGPDPWEFSTADGVPVAMIPVLEWLLQKDPQLRLDSAARLVEVLDQPESIRRPSSESLLELDASVSPSLQLDEEAMRSIRCDDPPANNESRGSRGEWKRWLPSASSVVKRPRYPRHWLELGVSLLLVPAAFLAAGAQASELGYGARLAVSLTPAVAALMWAAMSTNPGWNGSFARTGWICCGAAVVVAHLLGPSQIAASLLTDPVWFLSPFEQLKEGGVVAQLISEISRQWAMVLIELGGARPPVQ